MPKRAVITADFDPDILRALGRIVVEFNLLEASLSIAIQLALSGNSASAEIVIAELSTKNRADILFSILRSYNSAPDVVKRLDAIRVAVTQAEADRNRYLHSVWSPEAAGTVAARKASAKGKHGLVVRRDVLGIAEINEAADRFHAIAEQLVTTMVDSSVKLS